MLNVYKEQSGFFNYVFFISYCGLIYYFTIPHVELLTKYKNLSLASAMELKKKINNGDVTKPLINIAVLTFFIFFYSYFSVAGDKKLFFDEHVTLIFSMIFLFIVIILVFGFYYTHKISNSPEYNEITTLINDTKDKVNKEIDSIYSIIRGFLLQIDGTASKPGEFLCSIPKINTKIEATELMEKVAPLLNTIGISPATDIDIKDIIDAIPDVTSVLNDLGDSIPSVELVPKTTIDLKSFVSGAGDLVNDITGAPASFIESMGFP